LKGLSSCLVTAVRLCFMLQLQLFSIESKPEALINLRYHVARMSIVLRSRLNKANLQTKFELTIKKFEKIYRERLKPLKNKGFLN
jgi:hypothetical protein